MPGLLTRRTCGHARLTTALRRKRLRSCASPSMRGSKRRKLAASRSRKRAFGSETTANNRRLGQRPPGCRHLQRVAAGHARRCRRLVADVSHVCAGGDRRAAGRGLSPCAPSDATRAQRSCPACHCGARRRCRFSAADGARAPSMSRRRTRSSLSACCRSQPPSLASCAEASARSRLSGCSPSSERRQSLASPCPEATADRSRAIFS